MKPIINLLLITLLYQTTHAQHVSVIPITNPSMEGPTGLAIAPSGWDIISGTPDTGPNNGTEKASDKATFVRLVNAESIGQQLLYTLIAGKTYTLSFDMAPSITTKGTMLITGRKGRHGQEELLWKSGLFSHVEWKRYTVTFTPTQNIDYIILDPYTPSDGTLSAAKLDNFSSISEIIRLDLTATNTCPGVAIGSVNVSSPFADENYTYLWEPGGYTTPGVNNLPAGTYEVTVVDTNKGMTASKSIEVRTSVIKTAIDIKKISCYGSEDAIIHITASDGHLPYHYWLNDDSNTSGYFTHLPPGSYTVKINDSIGCSSIQENIVIYDPAPLLLNKISIKTIACNSAANGQIILTPTGGTLPYTYSIPGYTSQSGNTLGPLNAGTYHYVITDSHNCMIDSTVTITKDWRECAVHVPNAFSPDGDGINDLFRVKIQDDISDYRMVIYGRWGQLVYETRQPEAGWNGTFKGVKLPAGDYIWAITYTDSKNQLIKQQGSVIIIK